LRSRLLTRAGAVVLAIVLLLLAVPIAGAAAPANDDFGTAASISSYPFNTSQDTSDATLDPNDPIYCAPEQEATVWYTLTNAESRQIYANTYGSSYDTMITVVMGTPGGFGSVTCGYGSVDFLAVPNQTYYLMIGKLLNPYPSPDSTLVLEVFGNEVQPPEANFYYYPPQPSTYDTIEFINSSYDGGVCCIDSWVWDFGDGATAEGYQAFHRYAENGDYTVQLTVTTADGRTDSTSQVVHVQTHDVSVVKIAAPKSGRVNQIGKVSVSLASKLAAETVRVDLYKILPGGESYKIGYQELLVPARSSNRTVTVNFSYTFTSADATIGKVTFNAVATIVDAPDVLPGDNEARVTTKVTR
jgi:PKD repeat protein